MYLNVKINKTKTKHYALFYNQVVSMLLIRGKCSKWYDELFNDAVVVTEVQKMMRFKKKLWVDISKLVISKFTNSKHRFHPVGDGNRQYIIYNILNYKISYK